MPKQEQRPRQLDSLIPTIKTEERRLDELLTEARARAQQTVAEARRQAAAKVESTRQSLPDLCRAERASRLPALKQKAAAAAAEEELRARTVEARARAAMNAAVDFIVSLVWPAPSARDGPVPPGGRP